MTSVVNEHSEDERNAAIGLYKTGSKYGEQLTEAKVLRNLNIQAIEKLLVHRYPFMMIDRVVEITSLQKGVGYKNISINEPQFQGHFPGLPIMPGVLQVEAAAQLACMVILTDPQYSEGYLGVFTGIDGIKFRRMVVPGDRLDIEVNLTKFRYPFGKFTFTCKVDGELASSGEISFAMQKKEEVTL